MSARSVGVLARTRWTGLGAIAAILLGAGGMLTASAANPAAASSFVPLTPCRLLDTRPATLVGARNTPLGSGETFATAAWGANGMCDIPSDVTALSMNVVAVNGTSSSYLTVFPTDATLPLSSNLNWITGAPPTPNAVTVSLSVDGRLSFYNNSGSVDLAVDIVGYYIRAGAGPAGPTGPMGQQGVPGVSAPRPAQVIVVAKSGGDFISVGQAMASITDNSLFRPYLIQVAPGIYPEEAGVSMKDYVDIEGSGRDVTTLLCGGCGRGSVPTDSAGSLLRANGPNLHAEVRDLTVALVDSGASYQAAIWVGNTPDTIAFHDVGVSAVAGIGRFAYGLFVSSGPVTADGLVANITGAGTTVGVLAYTASANVMIRGSSLRGSTSMSRFATAAAYAFDTMFNGDTNGMSGRCVGAVYTSLTAYNCL